MHKMDRRDRRHEILIEAGHWDSHICDELTNWRLKSKRRRCVNRAESYGWSTWYEGLDSVSSLPVNSGAIMRYYSMHFASPSCHWASRFRSIAFQMAGPPSCPHNLGPEFIKPFRPVPRTHTCPRRKLCSILFITNWRLLHRKPIRDTTLWNSEQKKVY